jgi:adenosylcobinamide amidohydrolase
VSVASPWRRAAPAVRLLDGGRLLSVELGGAHDVLSWATVNGGLRVAERVVWRHVEDGELARGVDPAALLEGALALAGLDGAVGVLTARALDRYEAAALTDGDASVRVVATVGLGNALACGDPPIGLRAVGTINVLCQVSRPLVEEALVEAIALTAEARTAALYERAVKSRVSERLATGTGTDCIVVAAPRREPRAGERHGAERYVGKHTPLGALIGRGVHEAVGRGVDRWLAEQR